MSLLLWISICGILIIFLFIGIYLYQDDTKKNRKRLELLYHQIKNENTSVTNKNRQDLSRYPILYINLDDSIERRTSFEFQAALFGIVPHRISAIDYRSVDRPDWDDEKKKEHACSLSHLKAMKYAFHKGWDVVLILEDDACFMLLHYWPETLSGLITELDPSWELLNLSFTNHGNIGHKPYLRKGVHNGAVGYCVHKRGLQKVYGFDPGCRHIRADEEVYRLFLPHAYYSTFPLFIPFNAPRQMGSTIHDSHTDGHIKRSLAWVERLRLLRSGGSGVTSKDRR